MRLDLTTLDELSVFYARRLPHGAVEVAAACGLPTPQGMGAHGWRDLLATADRLGRVHDVATRVSGLLPGDENAREAARSLAPGARSRAWAMVPAAVAILFVVGSAVAMSGVASAMSGAAAANSGASVAAAAPAEGVATPVAAPVAPQVAELTPALASSPALAPVARAPAPATKAPSYAAVAAVATAPPAAHALPSACKGSGTIGWFYAGSNPPGKAGETVLLKRGATVRATPPGDATHWQLAPAVRCGLEAGETITLGEVRTIPGGIWVELPGQG